LIGKVAYTEEHLYNLSYAFRTAKAQLKVLWKCQRDKELAKQVEKNNVRICKINTYITYLCMQKKVSIRNFTRNQLKKTGQSQVYI